MAAHQRRHVLRRNMEHLRGSCRVDIHAGGKRLLHVLILRDMRQHTQLNLAVVGVDKHAAVLRHEHFSNFAPQFGTNRNILQVRFCRGKPPRRCDHVLERCVNSAVTCNFLDQPIGVGRFQFRKRPIIQNRLDDRVPVFELFQYLGIRRVAAFRLLDRRQLQLFKEDFAQLLG